MTRGGVDESRRHDHTLLLYQSIFWRLVLPSTSQSYHTIEREYMTVYICSTSLFSSFPANLPPSPTLYTPANYHGC